MEFEEDEYIRVAGIPLNPNDLRLGVLYVGGPGTGKSSLIKKQIKDAAWVGDSGVILDVSDEMTDYLLHHGPPGIEVMRIDPHRAGGVGLDLAAALDCQTRWEQGAFKIAPDLKGDSSPFFRSYARPVLAEGMFALNHWAPKKWTLGDLIKLCNNRSLYSLVLKATPGANDPYVTLGNNDSARDVAGTIVSLLSPMATFAALNDATDKKVSPLWALQGKRRWMVLVRDDRLTATVEAIHSLVIDMIIEEALSSLSDERFHVVCDEIRAYQPLKMLSEVSRRARKSSACLTLSVHECEGMHERYGRELAEELMSLMAHKVVLRCAGVNTAEWCSKVLGTPEVLTDIPPLGNQPANWTRHLNLRPNVIADQIRRGLPLASWEDDKIKGFLEFPGITAPFSCPFREDNEAPKRPRREHLPPSTQRLGPMKVEDLTRLNIPTNQDMLKAIGVL